MVQKISKNAKMDIIVVIVVLMITEAKKIH